MSFPRYERYKESGVGWLGEIPEQWEIRRLRLLFEIRKRIVGELGPDVLSITQQGIKVRDTESNDGQVSMDYSKYQIVEPGDFAMNHMDLLTGYVDISNVHGVTSPDYRVFTVRDRSICDDRYFLYLFQNAYKGKIFYAFGQGSSQLGRWRLPTEAFNDFGVPLPPATEQSSIVQFLDSETSKIDALVEEQRLLIELLKEKRQAAISHAVTKGLNPNAPMKYSEVPSIGSIPAHWGVTTLKRLTSEPLMYGANEAAEEADRGNPRFVRITDISPSGDLRDDTFRSLPLVVAEPFLLTDGDLLLARSGGTVGKSFIYRDSWGVCCFAGYLIRARINREVASAAFVYAFLQSVAYWEFIASEQIQSTIQNVNAEKYGSLPMTCPPINEQVAICVYLDCFLKQVDELISQSEDGITLLHERRSALISAAVTGKIDVRSAVPSEVTELEEAYEPA